MLLYKVRVDKDADAFAELYDLYVEPVYRFVFFKISHKEEAEDLVSDVFLRSWQYLVDANKEDVRNFSSLVYTIARRRIVDVYRDRSKRQESSIDSVGEIVDQDTGHDIMIQSEDAKRLLGLVHSLKQEYQEAILLRYVEGFPLSEVAAIMGKSPTSIRVTIHRAIKKLKSLSQMS